MTNVFVISKFEGEFAWLSNFFPCTVYHEGLQYPSSEHAYQAAKTLDRELRLKCVGMSAGWAKRWGRKIAARHDWEDVKIRVMSEILWSKFTDNPELGKMLLDTGDADIVETNTWGDTFWGVCNGKGENWLGRLLVAVRSDLR